MEDTEKGSGVTHNKEEDCGDVDGVRASPVTTLPHFPLNKEKRTTRQRSAREKSFCLA